MRAEYRALLVGVERVGGVVGSVMRAEYRALFVSVLFLRMRRQAWSWNAGRACGIAGLLRLAHMAPNWNPAWVASSFSLLIGTPWLLLLIVLMIGCDVEFAYLTVNEMPRACFPANPVRNEMAEALVSIEDCVSPLSGVGPGSGSGVFSSYRTPVTGSELFLVALISGSPAVVITRTSQSHLVPEGLVMSETSSVPLAGQS